jgi:hypothetical protein
MNEIYYRIIQGEHAGKKGKFIRGYKTTATQGTYILEIDGRIMALFSDYEIALDGIGG